jgi:acetamidase/formamidase
VATHYLDSRPETVTDVFSRDLAPVLTVDPGDRVVVHSLDAHGYLERLEFAGDVRPTMFSGRRGHCLCGPIAVRGAIPGMALAVRFVDLRPDAWGWTTAGSRDTPLNRQLNVSAVTSSLIWEIDGEALAAASNSGQRVRLAPFLGVVGMPPDEPGEHSTIPPRTAGGGNIDCRSLVAGSVLYLPVTVPGALLCVGDGHAAQGDGEVGGTAIECGMTTEMELDLVADVPVDTIHATTPSGRITFGFSSDLNQAAIAALDAMLAWMQRLLGLQKVEALALASVVVDLRVTQVANEVWGVHAVLPHDALG